MEIKKTRSSNFELLRIVAMLMIVMYHIVVHCVYVQLASSESIARWNNGYFNHPKFYYKLQILSTIMPFGIIGNAIFILISGFFMVPKKEDINIAKVSKKLLLQQGFAAVLLVLASTSLYRLTKMIPGRYIGMESITIFNGFSWFIGYYFLVILIAFLFLNKFLAKLDKSKYATFVITIFAFTQFEWSGDLVDGLAPGLRVLCTGIFLYSLGGLIKLYDLFKRVKSWAFLLMITITYGFIYISSYNSTAMNIENYERYGSEEDFTQVILGYDNYSIVIMIISISIFMLFNRIHIPDNRFINFLGASTFMVCLVHDNSFAWSIWDTQDWITLLYNNPYHFIAKLGVWTLLTFAFGVISYSLYLLLLKMFQNSKGIFLKPNDTN